MPALYFFLSRNRYSFWWDLSVAAKCPGEKKATEIPEESYASGEIYGHPVIPCRFPTSAEIVFALHPGEKLLTSARKFRNISQWNFHSPPGHLAWTYLIIEWTLIPQKQGMGNNWSFTHEGTDQNLQDALAGFWGFSRSKKTIRLLSYGSKKLLPPLVVGKVATPFFIWKKNSGPLFSLGERIPGPLLFFVIKCACPTFTPVKKSPSPPCS